MSWITPLGLPISQPYRTDSRYQVKTVLQTVVLSVDSEFLPISIRKQKSAFPPNFVHSLDATHMAMTSLKMKMNGLTFAAVHDSYWTHAADVDIMRQLLRESFVELYKLPILEDLRDSVKLRFPDIELPEVPKEGELDIMEVLDSEYFFH